MADGYILSEEDLILFKAMAEEYRHREGVFSRPKPRELYDLEGDYQASDVYIAVAPSGGIPALSQGADTGTGTGTGGLTDDVPGYADCDIHRIVLDGSGTPSLVYTGFNLRVYNLSTYRVPAGSWVTPMLDKFGFWIVPNPGYLFGTCP